MKRTPVKQATLRLLAATVEDVVPISELYSKLKDVHLGTMGVLRDSVMRNLVDHGYIVEYIRPPDVLYELTPSGRLLLSEWEAEDTVVAAESVSEVTPSPFLQGDKATPRTTIGAIGTYSGSELGQTCMRPGAYDAFKLPSLIGNDRVNYRG